MNKGNWIAVDKNIVKFLPTVGPYDVIHAIISYSIDLDNGEVKSFSDYARLWGWSRTKVTRFCEQSESCPTNNPKALRKLIKFRIPKKLQTSESSIEAVQRPDRDGIETTTNNNNPNPNISTIFPDPFPSYFEILKSIPGYPFDPETDFPFLQRYEKNFPRIDMLSLLEGWKTYLLDEPLKKKSKPRGQLANQFDLAVKWGRHQKAPAQSEAAGTNMLEIMKAGEREEHGLFTQTEP